MSLNPNSYLIIENWMDSMLGLNSTESKVFSYIYGIDVRSKKRCYAWTNFIAEFCNVDSEGISKALFRLFELQYITIHTDEESNVNYFHVNLEKIDTLVSKEIRCKMLSNSNDENVA